MATAANTTNDLSHSGNTMLVRAIIYSVVVFAGVALIALVAITGIDWFYPALAYSLAVYVAWGQFFSFDQVAEQLSTRSKERTVPGNIESAVSRAWEEVLGVQNVKPSDNFFELGGDSITGIQLVAKLRKDLGAELAPRDIFSRQTLEEQAELIRERFRQAVRSRD